MKDEQRHPTSSTVHLYCVSCMCSHAFVSKYTAVNARLSLRVLPLLSREGHEGRQPFYFIELYIY